MVFVHKINILLIVLFAAVGVGILSAEETSAGASSMVFPVIGSSSYTNDYLQDRYNGKHHATDIFAQKGTPVVSVTDGTVVYAPYPMPSWGYMVRIISDSGWEYNYLHMNNDTPGTDDGRGGAMRAYAPGIKPGDRVRKGQLLGWIGDSGNAENTPPHLHFERYKPDGTPTNPYYALNVIRKISRPVEPVRQDDEILPAYRGTAGINVAVGNFAGDAANEVVTGFDAGNETRVSVYNKLNKRMYTFLAYNEGFTGGVDVAAGDVDGDGYDEIITGPASKGGPRIKIFEADGTFVRDIWAFDGSSRGGVRVATGDIDGDNIDEIIVGRGPGEQPEVGVYSADGTPLGTFLAGRIGFSGGIDVAAGDIDSDGVDEIVTGYREPGAPYIKSFEADGRPMSTILAYSSSYYGGIRVSVGETGLAGGAEEIAVIPAKRYVSLAKIYSVDGTKLTSKYGRESWWKGYYDITVNEGDTKVATGINRRSSVRDLNW